MKRFVFVLIIFIGAAGCTAHEARHDADVFKDGVFNTADFLMNPTPTP